MQVSTPQQELKLALMFEEELRQQRHKKVRVFPMHHHWRAFLQLFCRGQCDEPIIAWCIRCHGGVLAVALSPAREMGGKWLAYYYHPRCGARFTMDGYSFDAEGRIA